jgi:hypothetical protein
VPRPSRRAHLRRLLHVRRMLLPCPPCKLATAAAYGW